MGAYTSGEYCRLYASGTYFVCPALNLTCNFLQQTNKGRAAGAVKHLEFTAGGDQRIIVTRVGTIKAQRLNTTKISYYYDVHDNLSAGRLRRRILQALAALYLIVS